MSIILNIVFLGLIIKLILTNSNLKKYNESLTREDSSLKSEMSSLSKRNNELESRNQELKKYEDMKATDESIRESATQEAERIVQEANITLEEARANSEIMRKTARNLKQKAEEVLAQASIQAEETQNRALKRAEEIAGEAYEAKKNADLYTNTVKAMKNKIEGYGDEYLKPTHSLLDDLSEEYGFTQIGEELKQERNIIKQMIKEGSTATCDYVESYRRKTAEEFVLDAFNGKVESILSRVKSDNFGKLEQEIKDAFTLVNYNGKAFKNARITENYLSVRLKELELATKLYLYREQEKEEQRRIREEMREEEKARREYEKAIKDADAEEKRYQKALEQAQKDYEKIMSTKSEEEKAKYSQKIADLEKQLEEAQKLKEKAVSQAQLTRAGHVYIISNIGSFGESIYKIGMTRRLEPLDRVKELGDASVPFPFDVHAMIYSEDAPALENKIHREFNEKSVNLVNLRKEFFGVNLEEVEKFVKENHGEFKITRLAEAQQYRQTLEMRKKHEIPIYNPENYNIENEELATA